MPKTLQPTDHISAILNTTPTQRTQLAKYAISTVADLLYHFPHRYERAAPLSPISALEKGKPASVAGTLSQLSAEKTWAKKLRITKAVLTDQSGAISLIWFHQPYISRMLKEGETYIFTGTIGERKGKSYLSNPIQHPISAKEQFGKGPLPVYPETRGFSSRWFYFALRKIFAVLDHAAIVDPIPEDILRRYHLPDLHHALSAIHFPRTLREAEAARKRFAFEEIFLIQLGRIQARRKRDMHATFPVKKDPAILDEFFTSLPFTLTAAQERAIAHVLADLMRVKPMSRLLEGDVGSGKTVVALAAAFAAIKNGYQVAYMAPTEVLARQHFKTITELFKPFFIPVGLITSAECKKFPSKVSNEEATHIAKSQLLRWVESHAINFVVGTHALIQSQVRFKKLALAIVDEQHRFGVNQRFLLTKKSTDRLPHLLSMTATPIPRTLALTIYGDLDLTLLDELPPGRKRIITEIFSPSQRARAYQLIHQELEKGHQAYVVCSRIEDKSDDPGALDLRAVKAEHQRLAKEIFPRYTVGIIHGKLKPLEKEEAMSDFRTGKIHVLVATSVIEVGIDVPNATIILIEDAERFGLAQLHQLRGRVVRSSFVPYCVALTESRSVLVRQRLDAFKKAKNGFELAEHDLAIRGAGELSGAKQWGISDLGMEALKNIKMVEAARAEAQRLIVDDTELRAYPLLCEKLKKAGTIHFE